MSLNTHKEVIDLFSKSTPVCKMTIYRETLSECEDIDSGGQEGSKTIHLIELILKIILLARNIESKP